MKVACPKCGTILPASSLNVASDIAVCATCDEAFALSQLIDVLDDAHVRLDEPPAGAWFERTMMGWQVGATTRSWGALFIVPFMGVWSGLSMSGFYGTQIVRGEFNVFLSLFGLPFLAGTIMLGSLAVMTICGKTTVTFEQGLATVFVGAGPFGWRRQVDWGSVSRVDEQLHGYRKTSSDPPRTAIALIGKTRITFGTMLSDERRYFMLNSLRQMLGKSR